MGLISRVSSRTYRFSLRQPSTPKMENDNGRTFHEQAATNLVRNKLTKSKKSSRYTRSMEYVDKKCPFTGNVSIRGRILTGVVTTLKMNRTCAIRRYYLHYIKKYNRFEKRHKMLSAHVSPCFRDIKSGDLVTVGECRPLAKTVKFNVIKVASAGGKKGFDKF